MILPNSAKPLSRAVSADAGALGHPWGPLDLAAEQPVPEKLLVEAEEEGVQVGGGVDGLPFVADDGELLAVPGRQRHIRN